MINIDEIKEFLGSDNSFIVHLMEKFILESGNDLKKLRSASNEKNRLLTSAIAHKMLSSTRIFCLHELSKKLEAIEILTEKRYEPQKISELITEMELLWEKVIGETIQAQKELKL